MDIAAVAAPAVSFGDVATLFGESASRVVFPSAPAEVSDLLARAAAAGVPAAQIGTSAGIGSGSPSTAAWRSTSLLPTPKRYGRGTGAYFERTRAIA